MRKKIKLQILTQKKDLQSQLKINKVKQNLNFLLIMIQKISFSLRIKTLNNAETKDNCKKKDFEKECQKLCKKIYEKKTGQDFILKYYSDEFFNLIKFLYNLTPDELGKLNDENKIEIILSKEKKEHGNNFGKIGGNIIHQKDFSSNIQEIKQAREFNQFDNDLEIKYLLPESP